MAVNYTERSVVTVQFFFLFSRGSSSIVPYLATRTQDIPE